MTKKKSADLALEELVLSGLVLDQTDEVLGIIMERAMEIYAGAFAEWSSDTCIKKTIKGVDKWISIRLFEDKEYTTAELLTEFEKI